jgi:hypothetical protein
MINADLRHVFYALALHMNSLVLGYDDNELKRTEGVLIWMQLK